MLTGSPSRIFGREQRKSISEPRAGPAQSASGVVYGLGEAFEKSGKTGDNSSDPDFIDRRGPKSKKPDLWLRLRHDTLHDSISVKFFNRILATGVNLPE